MSWVKEIIISRGAWPVIIGKHRLDGIWIRERRTSTIEARIMLRTEDHRYIQAVWKEAAVSAHIVPTQVDEGTVMYPERHINCVETPTTTATP
eukprot:1959413-Amphidinium_carterae.2